MSDEAYARAVAREVKIWKPFVYSFPFNDGQTDERKIIFGLYSGSYKNRHLYLAEIEAEDLLNLLNDYNTKMAELTAQQQIVVADIVLKRYLASIDKLIHDEKMVTKQAQVDAEDAEMDAKIAALEADREALVTLGLKVAAETTKTNARIAELQAMISIEGVNLQLVDIEIAEKEIQKAKLDVEILNAANSILKIQLETVEAGLKLIDVDVSVARTGIEIETMERNIAKTELLEAELQMEQSRTTMVEAEKTIYEAKIPIEETRLEIEQAETELYEGMGEGEESILEAKKLVMDEEQTARLNALDMKADHADADNEYKKDLANSDYNTEVDRAALQTILDTNRQAILTAQTNANGSINLAHILAAQKLAQATIASSLSHLIGKL